ncbi:hypothetical protein O6H91_08G014600 [Diphasiastrum complanatum]|uniref:Uncharacterized protein n=1 Tax=Diphasiastrum complanatum TaxID=34168 RepID=A0ACC2CV19_DIPCM|nr:hypothetical protein O6H91_08G014600 [Diphasiastrum complanatum]
MNVKLKCVLRKLLKSQRPLKRRRNNTSRRVFLACYSLLMAFPFNHRDKSSPSSHRPLRSALVPDKKTATPAFASAPNNLPLNPRGLLLLPCRSYADVAPCIPSPPVDKWESLKLVNFSVGTKTSIAGNLSFSFLPDIEALLVAQASLFESSAVIYFGSSTLEPAFILDFINLFIVPHFKFYLELESLGGNCFLLHFSSKSDVLELLISSQFRFRNSTISSFKFHKDFSLLDAKSVLLPV